MSLTTIHKIIKPILSAVAFQLYKVFKYIFSVTFQLYKWYKNIYIYSAEYKLTDNNFLKRWVMYLYGPESVHDMPTVLLYLLKISNYV